MGNVMRGPSQEISLELRDTRDRYGILSRGFHWTIALLIAVAVPLGLWAASIGAQNTDAQQKLLRESLLFWHKSVGLTVLFLSVARVVWRLRSAAPPLPAELSRLNRLGAKAVHGLLYVLILGLPVTGILLSQAAGFPVSFFGLFSLPVFVHADLAVPVLQRPNVLAGILLHESILPKLLYIALTLHVLGLLKHHFVSGNKTIWSRMAGWRR
jgi:cytochrome b561